MRNKRIVIETPCEFESGVRHIGCDYSAHIVCNKCGWVQGVHSCTERHVLDPIAVIAAFNQVVTVQDILDALGEI